MVFVPRFLALFCPSKLISLYSIHGTGVFRYGIHQRGLQEYASDKFPGDLCFYKKVAIFRSMQLFEWVRVDKLISARPKWSIGFCDLWIIWIVLATKTDQKNIMFNTLIFKRFAYGGNNWKGGWMICLRLRHGWHKLGSSWDDDDDHFMGSIEWIRA